MMIRQKIKKDLEEAIKKTLGFRPERVYLEHPKNNQHGDYASNFALVEFKKIKQSKDPQELAQKIVGNFRKREYLKKVETISPGFINFHLENEIFISNLKKILKEKEKYGSSNIGKGKTIIIDYSSPNIAKPFGIGHLRSTIIGQAIYNIYGFLGYKVIGDNHIGDWGTQFGKLIYAIKEWSSPSELESMNVQDLVELYIRFHKEAEKNPLLNKQGRAWFKKLENGSKEARKIWKQCIEISQKEFNRIYNLLDIEIDYTFGESFYEDKTGPVIKEAKRLNIAKKSKEALIIETGRNIPPILLLKSDGATTYHTRDLATIKFRQKRFGPVDKMIYEVGVDQKLYFQQLFAAARKFKWGKKIKYIHVAHGIICLSTGRMSTRKGKVILLENVLNETIKRAKRIIEKNDQEISETEKEQTAKKIGVGAVKYNDLKQHYSKNITFEWDKMLNLQGNSGPYLQYAYARCKSILRKAGKMKIRKCDSLRLNNNKEISLSRMLYRFPEIVKRTAEMYSPNLICNYLFDLAQEFNNFYENTPVLKSKDKEMKKARLTLVRATAQTIKNGLKLLGISAPEKM